MNTITIAHLSRPNAANAICYQEQLFLTNQVENIVQFKYPCRVDGIIFLICLKGELHGSINLNEVRVRENDIIVNFAEDIIQIHDTTDLSACALVISSELLKEMQIDPRQSLDFYMDIKQHPLFHLPHEEISDLKHYYDLLRRNIENEQKESRYIIRGLLIAFGYTIFSLMHKYREREHTDTRGQGARNLQIVEQFMALLTQYHGTERNLQFFADKLFLTVNYLSGEIKEYTGHSASWWTSQYTLLEAKTMLIFSNLTVQEIAFQLNFPTQSAFGKFFKNQTGTSPNTFRKNHQKEL